MIKINKETMSEVLTTANTVCKSNNHFPLAENIHLKCGDGKLRVRSTDLENQFESSFNVEGDDEFEFSLPSKSFVGVVLKITKDEFELSHHFRENNSSYCLIKAGRGKYEIETTGDPFPFKDMSDGEGIELDFENFKNRIKRAATCPKPKELRPQLTGVGIDNSETGIRIVGARQSMVTKQEIECNGHFNPCLLPLRFCNLISQLQNKGLCTIYRDESRFGVNVIGMKLTTQLMNYNIVDYQKLFDQKPTKSITVNRQDFNDVIKRVGNFAEGDSSRIILEIKNDCINLIGDQKDYGNHAEEELTITNNGVDDMTIAVNAVELDNIFNCIESEYVEIFISAPNFPLYISPLGQEDKVQSWINATITIN